MQQDSHVTAVHEVLYKMSVAIFMAKTTYS